MRFDIVMKSREAKELTLEGYPNLINDLQATGLNFSWSNNQTTRVQCKLDRILVNSKWLLHHADSFVQYLSPGLSDHSPLKVSLHNGVSFGKKPFKYFKMWEFHPHFDDLVKQAWQTDFIGSPLFKLVKKLQHTKRIIKNWDFSVFRPFYSSLARCKSDLDTAQKDLTADPLNAQLQAHERGCKVNYLNLLRYEESFHRQKSRQTWLSEGDRNSHYFHAMTKARIARNSIRLVQKQDSQYSSDPQDIINHGVDFFSSLLNREGSSSVPSLPATRKLSGPDQEALCTPAFDSVRWDFLTEAMKAFALPKKTLRQIEREIRNFLWVGVDGKQKMHAVNWNTICTPLLEGGLGMRRITTWNEASIGARFWEGTNLVASPLPRPGIT
ncbi:hypothetical protein QJS10_CPA10g01647 [Acorus calamus]|uniref:Uncharacterized protein n=1 Tax=Acorus calamus TaxID=4465 RepID=A0AAV9E1F7_ACOCL|nr:hypothetical protein QJS10_CPA10g01647 [Acorus calamus]